MTLLNWVLGIAAMLLWIIPVVWFYRTDLMRAWQQRDDKWFRGE